MQGKVQGIRSIISRHKKDGARLRMVQETEKSTYMYNPWTWTKGGKAEGLGGAGRWGGDKGENWENCNI